MTLRESDFFYIFAFAKWFRGRVARQRSAKPRTAVRLRSKPQKPDQ